MDLKRFVELLTHLYNGNKLGAENQNKLDTFASKLLDQMEQEQLDFDSQNALDTYIEFFEGMKDISLKTIRNIRKYNQIIENRRQAKQKENNARVIKPIKKIDNAGVIKTITVIEIVCVLGIFIAIIILALIIK